MFSIGFNGKMIFKGVRQRCTWPNWPIPVLLLLWSTQSQKLTWNNQGICFIHGFKMFSEYYISRQAILFNDVHTNNLSQLLSWHWLISRLVLSYYFNLTVLSIIFPIQWKKRSVLYSQLESFSIWSDRNGQYCWKYFLIRIENLQKYSVLLRILLNQNWKLTEMLNIVENTSELELEIDQNVQCCWEYFWIRIENW